MLHASGINLKYWNFAFNIFFQLYNLVSHGDNNIYLLIHQQGSRYTIWNQVSVRKNAALA
jgi:hypothetical protein